MPLYFFYIMVQKSQKWTKTQIKGGGGGGSALISSTLNFNCGAWSYLLLPSSAKPDMRCQLFKVSSDTIKG